MRVCVCGKPLKLPHIGAGLVKEAPKRKLCTWALREGRVGEREVKRLTLATCFMTHKGTDPEKLSTLS